MIRRRARDLIVGASLIYRVRARFDDERLTPFHARLTDGTVAKQEPDGAEIVASMRRAVITEPGVAEWYETCFCSPPLKHERATQYDRYFLEVTTQEADEYGTIEGESLWSYMEALAASS